MQKKYQAFKHCIYCEKIYFRKDFPISFNRMKICGSIECKKRLRKDWLLQNNCIDCGKPIVYKANRCKYCSSIGINNPFYGKTHTDKTKDKLKLFHPGHIPYIKGKHHKSESNQKNREKHLGKYHSKNTLKKIFKKREMSSLEIKMYDIIIENNLPYIFVGNGKFFIERKCPDFININGAKIAIEVYYRSHKIKFGQAKDIGISEWKLNRQLLFNKYGWKIEYFDETEVNKNNVMRRLL